MRTLLAKIHALMAGRQGIEHELAEEVETHLEMEVEEHVSRGMRPDDARRAVRRTFGNRTLIEENARNTWRFSSLEDLLSDIVHSIRVLSKAPVFAAAAILTLGLGIGGNTAMFTVIRDVLLKPLPYADPEQLVRLAMDNPDRNRLMPQFTPVRYAQLREESRSFLAVGAFGMSEDFTLQAGSTPETLTGIHISGNFTSLLEVRPVLGRGFLPEEDTPGGAPVAMISAALWQRYLHSDPSIVGKTIDLDSKSYTVVGVLPPRFAFPRPNIDIWLPRPAEWSMIPPSGQLHAATLTGFARLRPTVTLKQAQAEIDVLNRQYNHAHPGMADANPGSVLQIRKLKDEVLANVKEMLWVLFGAVCLVLLIACANIASLLLARASSRSQEFAVRASLGASRLRLIRQLLTESILLAVAGGSLGVLFAKIALAAISHVSTLDLPQAHEIRLDGMMLAFTGALSVLTGLLFGLLPAFRASRPNVVKALRIRGEGAGHAAHRENILGINPRSFLLLGQIALSIVLLISAGLLLKSFFRLRSVDPGFRSSGLLTAQIALPPLRYDSNLKRAAFWSQLVQQLQQMSRVSGAAATFTLPMSPAYALMFQPAEEALKTANERPIAQFESVTPGYFETFGIPLRAGRIFTIHDNVPGGRPMVIINETLARRFWPGYPTRVNPVGKRLILGTGTSSAEIVGVVGDVHEYDLANEAGLEIYAPCALSPPQTGSIVVRTAGPPQNFAETLRKALFSIDPVQPVSNIQTMSERIDHTFTQRQTTLALLALFAAMATVLAAIGIYGVIAYSVTQRTEELGIRRALGAQNRDILRLVMGGGVRIAAFGIAAGLLGGLAATRMIAGLLFHVGRTDPATFVEIALLFFLVAIAACYFPAGRAIRIEPMRALR